MWEQFWLYLTLVSSFKTRLKTKSRFSGCWFLPRSILEMHSLALSLMKLLPSSIPKVGQPWYSFLFCLFSIFFFKLFDKGGFGFLVVLVIGVVVLISSIGGAMRIIPYKFLGAIELFAFENLGLRLEGVREDRLQSMSFKGWRRELTHNKIIVDKNNFNRILQVLFQSFWVYVDLLCISFDFKLNMEWNIDGPLHCIINWCQKVVT